MTVARIRLFPTTPTRSAMIRSLILQIATRLLVPILLLSAALAIAERVSAALR